MDLKPLLVLKTTFGNKKEIWTPPSDDKIWEILFDKFISTEWMRSTRARGTKKQINKTKYYY
jgi:hypothetical protein